MTKKESKLRQENLDLSKEQCGSCKFLIKNPAAMDLGECHRLPPTQIIMSTPKGPVMNVSFPAVRPEQWCGEYKPKVIQ